MTNSGGTGAGAPRGATRWCYANGAFVREAEATVSIFDRGLLFGDGVYEVAAVYDGRLVDADLHLERLERSKAAIELAGGLDADGWTRVMRELVERAGVTSGLVYLQVTRGVAERDFAFPDRVAPTEFAYVRSKRLLDDPNAAGIALHVVPDLRWARRDIKSTALLPQVLAKQQARAHGAFEALMHEDGVVTEGGSSNVWLVVGGRVVTRPLSAAILPGVTRHVVLGLARERGYEVEERAFTVDEAHSADECFVTSATTFVLPVVRIDERPIGSGSAGAVATTLRGDYFARLERMAGDEPG